MHENSTSLANGSFRGGYHSRRHNLIAPPNTRLLSRRSRNHALHQQRSAALLDEQSWVQGRVKSWPHWGGDDAVFLAGRLVALALIPARNRIRRFSPAFTPCAEIVAGDAWCILRKFMGATGD